MQSYKDLIVWQKGMALTLCMYQLTELFPKNEQYGLTAQMRKSSASIPTNIAEGSRRGTKKDYRNFIVIAFGSGAELETQIEISKRLSFGKSIDFSAAERLLSEIMKMLNGLQRSLLQQ